MAAGLNGVVMVPVARTSGAAEADAVAVEEPLAIRVNDRPLAVVMRTPGDDSDLELVTGFLRTEGIIQHIDDIRSMHHCTTVESPDAEDNVVQVRLHDHVDFEHQQHQRSFFASSSCGVCGKATLEQACRIVGAAVSPVMVDLGVLQQLTDEMRDQQLMFARTGGVHAVALFQGPSVLAVREDVGRHNALDKVVGQAMRSGVALPGCGVLLSGRVSFEMVQKAAAAGIGAVVAVSAPTSLAVAVAQKLGVVLVGFARGTQANVYSHAERVIWPG
jgi:FdhD protein